MTQLASSDLVAALNWRYAVKKFDPSRRIPADVWSALEATLHLSASSFGLQPWKFLVVSNPELRAKLTPLSWGQTQTVEASHFVVLAVRDAMTTADIDRLLNATAAARGVTTDSLAGFRKMLQGFVDGANAAGRTGAWNTNQVYIALGALLTAAATLGVDACPMEGIDPAGYDAALGLTGSGYHTVVACALGYRADDDKYAVAPKVRFPKSEVVVTL